MIIKTIDAHLEFIKQDLPNVIIYSKKYIKAIHKLDDVFLSNVGFGNQLKGTSIQFFGSYFSKEFGKYVSDIDIVEYVNIDNNFFKRFFQIMKNIKLSPEGKFKYIRMYCGYKRGLEIPWDLQSDKNETEGSCDFSLEKAEILFQNIRKDYPKIYDNISKYCNKDTLSIEDILNIENILKPINSLTWTLDEIISGKKIEKGIEYDFKEEFEKYPVYRVVKFLYNYGGKWCLVDINYRSEGIKRDFENIITFYLDDNYKKFKFIKYLITPEAQIEYKKFLSEKISYITPLAARMETVKILKKYENILHKDEIKKIEDDAKNYAKDNKISTIDYDEIQNKIKQETSGLFQYFRKKLASEFEINYFIYETRLEYFKKQINKQELKEREIYLGCPFFDINIENIEKIFYRSRNILLDPKKVLDCIQQVCKINIQDCNEIVKTILNSKYIILKNDLETYDVFDETKFFIQKSKQGEYILYKILKQDKNLKILNREIKDNLYVKKINSNYFGLLEQIKTDFDINNLKKEITTEKYFKDFGNNTYSIYNLIESSNNLRALQKKYFIN